MSLFKIFENSIVLSICVFSLLFTGFCFGVTSGVSDNFLQSIGVIGGFLSGLGTCLAVAIAWEAKQDWIHQRNFDVQDRLIKNTFNLYILGVESYNFCICVMAHHERLSEKEIQMYIEKTEKNYQDFCKLYDSLCADCIINDARNLNIKKHFTARIRVVENHFKNLRLTKYALDYDDSYLDWKGKFEDEMSELLGEMAEAHSPKSGASVRGLVADCYHETRRERIEDYLT